MTGTVIQVALRLIPLDCCTCGVWFAITETLRESREKDGEAFYCPNGHRQVFVGGEVETLRKRVREAEAKALRLQAEADQLKAEAQTVTRQRNRLHAGVCDQCQRTFANLQRHMADKHPAAAGVHRPAGHKGTA